MNTSLSREGSAQEENFCTEALGTRLLHFDGSAVASAVSLRAVEWSFRVV
jgi:hypothetical protein